MDYTLNCNGQLLDLTTPQVMGILNATPDSFYAASRTQTEHEIAKRAEEILQQGGAIIDVGACSTRPDSKTASEAEEAERLRLALKTIRDVAPDAIVSVDTFRPQLARMAVEEYGAAIINDVGAPVNSQNITIDNQHDMFRMVSRLRVPYIYICHAKTASRTFCLIVLRLSIRCAPWVRKISSSILGLALARQWRRTMR